MQQLTGLDEMFLSLDTGRTTGHVAGIAFFDKPAEKRDELAFLRGRIADAAVELAGLTVEVGLGDQQSFLNAVDGGQDVFAHGTDAAIQVHDHGVAFRGVA